MERNHLCNFERGHHRDQEEMSLTEKVYRRTKTKHNSSPCAFGSVALKSSLLMSSQVIKLGSIILSPSESLAIRSGSLHIANAQ